MEDRDAGDDQSSEVTACGEFLPSQSNLEFAQDERGDIQRGEFIAAGEKVEFEM